MTDVLKKKRVLAVASVGGHWIQLLRITKGLEDKYRVSYVSSNPKWSDFVSGNFYCVPDFSRWNAWRIIPSIPRVYSIIRKENPSVVISTGAAPGLLILLIAKFFFRKKTIWVDSIANAMQLSTSGKISVKMGIDCVYTQWEHLATSRVKYAGNVLGELGSVK